VAVRAARGSNKPLLVLSISSIALAFRVVGLLPTLSWAWASIDSNPAMTTIKKTFTVDCLKK
jgi:hypothetical protein